MLVTKNFTPLSLTLLFMTDVSVFMLYGQENITAPPLMLEYYHPGK